MTCPKCGMAQYPVGTFFVTPDLKFQHRIKLFFIWLPLQLSLRIQYCPSCGFLAVRDIQTGYNTEIK